MIWRTSLLSACICLVLPGAAFAGMPSVTLTDVARLRLESLSFFLVGFLLSAWAVMALWNYLRKDFAVLPRLTYPKALGMTALWGLLFVLVLTMISGARELMTPGAWERQGYTHKLVTASVKPANDATDAEPLWLVRERKLHRLWVALWDYARNHDGKFPAERSLPGVPDDIWQMPEAGGMKYYYRGGAVSVTQPTPVVFEPEVYGPDRFILFSNGEIKRLNNEQLPMVLPVEEK